MRKGLILLLIIIIGSVLFWKFKIGEKSQLHTVASKTSSNSEIISQKNKKSYLFVPYWTVSKNMDFTSFDNVIYFGLSANESGINTDDDGYKNLDTFVDNTKSSREKILAVTITDSDMTSEIMKNTTLQNKIIDESLDIAKKDNFDGVLLDFETSAFGFESTTNKISVFYNSFSKKAHEDNLLFYSTLFGDTYFRARAYNVAQIGKVSDKVLVMAYDFTKSSGNPGPDFPLEGREQYGYDMGQMVDDFQKDVPNEKLVITLGFFGYDWEVDNKNEALDSGVPLSTNEILQKFVDDCEYKSCRQNRTAATKEPSVTYIDADNQKHVVWFEDEASIAAKKEFLESRGIKEIGIWAYSYY